MATNTEETTAWLRGEQRRAKVRAEQIQVKIESALQSIRAHDYSAAAAPYILVELRRQLRIELTLAVALDGVIDSVRLAAVTTQADTQTVRRGVGCIGEACPGCPWCDHDC